ncbi:MAG: glycosyltransferase family 4 protein [bacterium]|nr:glycosyltransferase family 4 protein [bacterium]
MRVYIYTLRYNTVSGGGSHHSLEIFIRALITQGHIPILTTFSSDDNNYAQKPCEMREENFSGGFLALQRHIAKMMSENADADIHHLYGPTVMWAGGIYKQRGGTAPVVASINNYAPGMGFTSPPPFSGNILTRLFGRARHRIHTIKWYLWQKLIGIPLMRSVDLLFFDSPTIKECFERFGYRARSSIVLPAPIERVTNKEAPTPFGNDTKSFRVIFAGRLIADKGPDLIVKAALQLPNAIHIHIIGRGNEEERLKDFIRDNGLTERVFLHGWKSREELLGFYKNAHVFVHPSRWPDPFSRVVADALGCGLPIISTENTAPAWVAGDAGMTFPKEDIAGLVKCILFFFNNPNERNAYAKRAVERVRVFDADVVSRQFVENLESLANKKSA